MKKELSLISRFCGLLFICSFQPVFAQVTKVQVKVQPSCFDKYFDLGNRYTQEKNFDLAAKQYEAAKYCGNLTYEQRKRLDSLIADVNKRRDMELAKKKIITKKY